MMSFRKSLHGVGQEQQQKSAADRARVEVKFKPLGEVVTALSKMNLSKMGRSSATRRNAKAVAATALRRMGLEKK